MSDNLTYGKATVFLYKTVAILLAYIDFLTGW